VLVAGAAAAQAATSSGTLTSPAPSRARSACTSGTGTDAATSALGSAPASGVTWKLNGSTLSDPAATTLTSTGTYGSTGSHDNAIGFTAVSN
jgi:hypothetical protein